MLLWLFKCQIRRLEWFHETFFVKDFFMHFEVYGFWLFAHENDN